MTARTKNRWLTIGFWGVWVVGLWVSTEDWRLGLVGVLVMIVLDQYTTED